jgi:hypothetical protein
MDKMIDLSIQTSIDRQLLEEALYLSKRRALWSSSLIYFQGLVKSLEEIGIEPTMSTDINVSFTGDKERLEKVWHIIRLAGFELSETSERPKAGDDKWSGYFFHPECKMPVWLFFTSSVCRRVKVGTKLVEQDIYETICGEETPVAETTVARGNLVELK